MIFGRNARAFCRGSLHPRSRKRGQMGFGNNNSVVDIWQRKRFWLYKTTPEMTVLIYQQFYGEYNAQKKNPMFVLGPLTNRYNFQLSIGCTHLGVHWGHVRRHGKRSLEMLTVGRADYLQEMDCHCFNFWSVHRWRVCKSWLVLMCQLNIVVFRICATFACPFGSCCRSSVNRK